MKINKNTEEKIKKVLEFNKLWNRFEKGKKAHIELCALIQKIENELKQNGFGEVKQINKERELNILSIKKKKYEDAVVEIVDGIDKLHVELEDLECDDNKNGKMEWIKIKITDFE